MENSALWLVMMIMIFGCYHQSFAADSPIVNTTLGQIQGVTLETFKGKTIYGYRGIRYAQSPVGELRFAPPKPVESWGETVLDARWDSQVCPQTGIVSLMTEDCLKLNVFTKSLESKLPVIVYIHGGANVLGSGSSIYEAGPEYLLDHEIVFVAFNYRLGALGFLSTGANTTYSGNYGYLDQVLALQWVQSHISDFGGDPERVTILGLSAGSMAVSLHLASPLSKGLFHGAILMSGSATNHYNIDNLFWTRKLAKELGCPLYEPANVIKCLRSISWETIIEVCSRWETYKFYNMKWNYEIDGHFMPEHPTELIARGDFHRVPLLVSYTANETDYSTFVHENNTNFLEDIYLHFDKYAPELFLYNPNDGQRKSERLKEFYLPKDVEEIDDESIESLGRLYSDAIIGHGVHRVVDLAKSYTNVYHYRMDYVGQRTLQLRPDGVGHGDDLQYIVTGLWYGTQFPQDHPDVFMMERITKWFSNFATNGKPLTDDVWQPCDENDVKMLYNNVEFQMGDPAYSERYALWDDLFPKPRKSGSSSSIIIGISGQLTIYILAFAIVGLRN